MYQIATKIYENELTWIEYIVDVDVKLKMAVFKFRHSDKPK